jgi:hypothetical protein
MVKEYTLECFAETGNKQPESEKKPAFEHPTYMKAGSPLLKLKKISQLEHNHPAKEYVESRMIPTKFHSKLFYCSKFAAWTNCMIPGKLNAEKDTPRLIIPFLDKDGQLFGYQGRSFNPNDKIRYITIMLEDRLKTFGLDTLDQTKQFFIVEGPIDSMFLPNAIAMAGADMNNKEFLNDNAVYVYDNEPRNPDIVKRMGKVLERGDALCIWPQDMQYKDINDMIIAGITQKELLAIVQNNIYKGLAGLMKYNEWKKI